MEANSNKKSQNLASNKQELPPRIEDLQMDSMLNSEFTTNNNLIKIQLKDFQR